LVTGLQGTIRLHLRCQPSGSGGQGGCAVVLAGAGLKAGQEDYWIRQIAQSGCEYQRPGVSPGRWYGAHAAAVGLAGIATDAQCHAMFEGKDPVTGQQLAPQTGEDARQLRQHQQQWANLA
jgi:hypothetical protein